MLQTIEGTVYCGTVGRIVVIDVEPNDPGSHVIWARLPDDFTESPDDPLAELDGVLVARLNRARVTPLALFPAEAQKAVGAVYRASPAPYDVLLKLRKSLARSVND